MVIKDNIHFKKGTDLYIISICTITTLILSNNTFIISSYTRPPVKNTKEKQRKAKKNFLCLQHLASTHQEKNNYQLIDWWNGNRCSRGWKKKGAGKRLTRVGTLTEMNAKRRNKGNVCEWTDEKTSMLWSSQNFLLYKCCTLIYKA